MTALYPRKILNPGRTSPTVSGSTLRIPQATPRSFISIFIVLLLAASPLLELTGLPFAPTIPAASGALAGDPALLGLFNEQRKTSAIIDSSLGAGAFIQFDVNVTNAGLLKGFDITLNWTSTSLMFSNSTYSGSKCSTCIFNSIGSGAVKLANQTSPDTYHLAVDDQCTTGCNPFVNGNGILFRIAFRVQGTSKSTPVHINTGISSLLNPASVPYQSIDGYFDNNSPALFNYALGISATSTLIMRPVSGTNTTLPLTVSLGSPTGTATSVVLNVLGLPAGGSFQYTSPSCTPACTSSLTITVQGGSAGASTPSGTYPLAITGNSTVNSGQMVKEVWLSLTVAPPNPPVYTLTSSPATTFTAEAGASSLFTLNATLTSGANDTITENGNCVLVSITCTILPPSGSFPATPPQSFFSTLNVTTSPSMATGTYKFNVTATTTGTYSEKPVTVRLAFTLTLIRTHDLRVTTESVSRSFSYAGVSLALHPIQLNVTIFNAGTVAEAFTVNGTAKTVLKQDLSIEFVDANNNGFWDPGETVVYDTNFDGTYDMGDLVIAGVAPALNTPLLSDINILFVDRNFNNVWNTGEGVAYDSNGNGLYDQGETIIAGPAISPGFLVSTQTVNSLAPGSSVKVSLNFDPGSIPRGNYLLSAMAIPVPGELLVSNNVLTLTAFTQRLKGDVNSDCKVDISDLATAGSQFSKTRSSPGFNPSADLNNDGVINIVDLVLVAGGFGTSC